MSKSDVISVIIPVFNTGSLLKRCVNSVLKQEYHSIEIIIVDDGSRDALTLEICDEYESKYDNIKVIHQFNKGSSEARNTGIKNATGEYIAFVDGDDWIDSNAYNNLLSTLKEYEVPLVLGQLMIESENKTINVTRNNLRDGVYNMEEILREFMLGSWHSACTNLYHKDLFKFAKFPPGEINEDYIFNFNVILNCKRIAICTTPFYHYWKGDESSQSTTNSPASKKHYDWLKHTQEVKELVTARKDLKLEEEAIYQDIFANIVLANKCLLSINAGYRSEPNEMYNVTTHNLKTYYQEIKHNPYLSRRYRAMGTLLSRFPKLYRLGVLGLLRLKR